MLKIARIWWRKIHPEYLWMHRMLMVMFAIVLLLFAFVSVSFYEACAQRRALESHETRSVAAPPHGKRPGVHFEPDRAFTLDRNTHAHTTPPAPITAHDGLLA